MTIIGFDYTKMSIEKKKILKGKINIANNVSIKNVEEIKLSLGANKNALKFSFQFTTKYEPDVGDILIEGDLLYMVTKEESKDLLGKWNKDKKIPKEIMNPILNYVLTKCNIQALILSKEMNLPAPIPLPRVGIDAPEKEKME